MKPLAITLGDPAGIGPEVVFKSLGTIARPVIVFGSWDVTRECAARFAAVSPQRVETWHDRTPREGEVLFVDVGFEGDFSPGRSNRECGAAAVRALDAAVDAVTAGECAAMVTAPLSKESVATSVAGFSGHTEYLANRAGLRHYGREFAMYFDSPTLRVALLTVHVSVGDAIGAISGESVRDLAVLVSREYQRLHGQHPRMAVAALNPHAGESGMFGHEEERIAEGVELARSAGCDISGPHAADTVFLHARRGRHDVVIAMFHDQGLIPVKTLHFEESVNVTLGLPYLRASVDHGTAFDIAGRGIADERPMRYAIEWTSRHAQGYRA